MLRWRWTLHSIRLGWLALGTFTYLTRDPREGTGATLAIPGMSS